LTRISTEAKTFKAFRLEIASSILRNNPHISVLSADIGSQAHIIELCDTYAMRLLLAWLATKYGCFLSTSAIPDGKPDAVPSVERFFLSVDIYPFAQGFPISNETELLTWANAFLDAAFEPSIELAGSLYEHLTSSELEFENADGQSRLHIRSGIEGKHGRRKKGQFYTPPWVVDYCLERSLDKDLADFMKALQQQKDIENDADSHQSFIETTSPLKFKILDPACGTGNFLLGIVRFLIAQGAAPDAVLHAAINSIYGRDVDGKAISIAIWSIALSVCDFVKSAQQLNLLLKRLSENLRVTDSVFDSYATREENEFDLVITNPPYISFGSRGQETILPSTSTFLRQNFPLSAEYKIRLNSIFQEVALNYVRDGGKICLFIPNGFLTGQGYAKLRANLLKRTRIISLSELPDDTIKSAVVGRWCAAVYERCDHADGKLNYQVDLVSIKNSLSRNEDRYRLPASHLVTKDQSRFRLVFQEVDEQLALKMEQLAPLSTMARGHTGIRARNGQKTILAEEQKNDRFKKGIRSGGRISPYGVDWDGTWIQIESSLLYAGGFDRRVIENPKILVRQTADRIIAAYDEDGLYHLNNVHSFSGQLAKSKKQIDLHFLLALMNSSLWHYIYRLKTREDGRVLAQIDIESVDSMPLPNCGEELVKRVAKISKRFSENRSHLPFVETLTEIDQLVYAAYGLSRDEIEHVESSLGLGYNSELLKTGAG